MSTDDDKALVTRFVDEVLNKGNVAALREFVSPRVVDHHPNHQSLTTIAAELSRLRTEVPDLRYAIESILAEGDTVAVRLSVAAQHTAQLPGAAPGVTATRVTALHMLRIGEGKIVEHWGAVLPAAVQLAPTW